MRAVIVPAAVFALSGSALGSDAPKAEDKQAAPTDAQKSQQSSGADDYYKNYLAKYENSKAAGPDESTKSSKDNAYSNSYAQYMKQSGGQGGQSSNGGAGGYDKYYQQYMQQSGSKGDAGSAGGAAGYDKYYKQYMQKSGGKGGDSSAGGAGGYDKYYKQYMQSTPGQGGGSSAGGASGGGASGYDKYYKQYTSDYSKYYQKYTQQKPAEGKDKKEEPASDEQETAQPEKAKKETAQPEKAKKETAQPEKAKKTHHKDADGDDDSKPHAHDDSKPHAHDDAVTLLAAPADQDMLKKYVPEEINVKDPTETASNYRKKYVDEYTTGGMQGTGGTGSDDAMQKDPKLMRDHFMKQYASGYVPPKQENNTPMAPTECKTVDELKAWRAAKVWSIKQYVPESYQGQSVKNIQADYKTNMLRLQKEAEAEASAAKAAVSTEDTADSKATDSGVANLAATTADQQDMMKQYVPSEVNVKDTTETAGNYQKKYVDEYMSGSLKTGSTGGDAMQSDPAQMRDHFMKQYASGYVPPKQQTNTPMAAEDCKSVDELKAWKAAKVWSIKKYVPESYQGQSVKNIQADFKTNMLRLQHESEAKAAAAGAALETEDKAAPAKTEEGPANLAAVAVDQQNMMKQYVPSEVNVQNTQETASNYQKKYVDEYTANMKTTGGAGGDAMESNPTQMRDHFMKQYASGYVPPKQQNNTPMAPQDCKTVDELKAWKAAKVWSIKQYVPESYQGQSVKNIQADFKTNMLRLQHEAEAKAAAAKAAAETEDEAEVAKTVEGPANLAAVSPDQQDKMNQYVPAEVNVKNMKETAGNYQKKYVDQYTAGWMKTSGGAGADAMDQSNPTQMRDHFMQKYATGYVPPKQENNTPMAPEDCKTVDELKAWKAAKVWSIKQYVPKSYAGQSEKNIEADFQTNMKRLQREADAKAAAEKAAAAAKSKAAAEKKESESLRGSSSADSKHDDASSETADSPKKHVEDAKPDAEPVEAVGLAEEAPGASVPLLFAIAALPMLAVTAFLHKFSKPERRQLDQPFLG
eukprot:TRINITY_DN1424_c0_g1_i8.p1 TRINITY_DN1424_c0_g1~~TRINITY_DN1424_c0_g1_i8.p1  ORF type:complete len:1033 (+),score=385.55 TRINITY_DN1424_c0_g1_i8:74-3172(+)